MRRQPPPLHVDPCEVLIDILLEFIEEDAGETLPAHVADAFYYFQADPPRVPTAAVAGSEEKIAVMAERYRLRQRLNHPRDNDEMGKLFKEVTYRNGRSYLVERT